MKILITGGFGFLGQRLCKRILALGELVGSDEQVQQVSEIVLFDLATPPAVFDVDQRVRMVSGDVTDAATCSSLIDQDGMTVFHLASIMSGQGEIDFDLCFKVNLEGTRNLMEACRRRQGCKFIFASTGACYGERPDGPETDSTKLLPYTTYGMTKACVELMVNDYSRRGFLDGRVARLPTVIPRPEVNTGLPAAFSAVIREPLKGHDVVLPIRPDMPHAVCGFRVLVHNLVRLSQLPQAVFADSVDRCMNMPALSLTLNDLHSAVLSVARHPEKLGKVTYQPDEALTAKLGTFHRNMDATRAKQLGMLGDSAAAAIVTDFASEYVDAALIAPVLELRQEPRHNLILSNATVRVFRTEFPAGDSTLTHVHRVDSLYFFFCSARIRNAREGQAAVEDTISAGEVRYGDHCNCALVHKITNLGPTPMFCLDVELAGFDRVSEPVQKKARVEELPQLPTGLCLSKERRGARVYELEVAAGSSWRGLLPFPRMLWVVQTGAQVRGSLGDRLLLPGEVSYHEGPLEASLELLDDGPTTSGKGLAAWIVELL